jgi:hypothetical protein
MKDLGIKRKDARTRRRKGIAVFGTGAALLNLISLRLCPLRFVFFPHLLVYRTGGAGMIPAWRKNHLMKRGMVQSIL